MKVDILAIAAHPDDAELSCSGTLLIHKKLGLKTGILDLTAGELGSRGNKETRASESANAAKILQLDVRENLGFRDGFFQNDEAHLLKLITALRKYQPEIVLANAISDRHPDHEKAALLIKDACFLAGLIKIETTFNGETQKAWRPKKIFNYIQDRHLEPDFVIDISDVWETKKESILAYRTQFYSTDIDGPNTYISSPEYLNSIEYRNVMMGKKIGVKYGEGFTSTHSHLGLKDFSNLVFPKIA
jgi:bacillithiol biosynthesis deacetylase BshB1